MFTRFVAPLCCAAAVAFACGPRPHSAANAFPVPAKRPDVQRTGVGQDTARITQALSVRLDDGVRLALQVTNNGGKQTEINFPSGQMYDFRVLDVAGREVWRWSDGRMFTQSLQNRLLSDGESMTFKAHWEDERAHGTYTAVATLMSTDHPMESRAQFTLP
jgi:Intracellular proteinase inhibitor